MATISYSPTSISDASSLSQDRILPATSGDVFPGIEGDERVFVTRDACGSQNIYIETATFDKKNKFTGYKTHLLQSVTWGDVESVSLRFLDKDDHLDVSYTVRARYQNEPSDIMTYSYTVYAKDFAPAFAAQLGYSLNQLYYDSSVDISECPERNIDYNSLEYPECEPILFDE